VFLTFIILKKKAKNQGNGSGEGEESDEPLTLDEHLGGSLSDEEKERLQDIVSSAAKAAGKGNCPDEIWKKVGELKESKVNWKELLSALFSSQIISDYSYALPNKRSLWLTQFCQSKGFIGSGTSIILPTETVEGLVRADIYSDVSGSIPNSVKLKCLSEIVALTEAFGDFELTVQTWACRVFDKSRKKYDSSNSQEILNYSFIGTGGTDVYCVLDDAMNKESGEDNGDSFIIILTDGYFSQNKDDKYQELSDRIIWVVFDNPNFKSLLETVCHYKD
jgi:predicted metal-dependent peptidase